MTRRTSRAQEQVTFRLRRNVTLEESIRREVFPKTEAFVRFLALRQEPPPGDSPAAVQRTYWQRVRRQVIEALADHLSRGFGGRGRATLPDDVAALLIETLKYAAAGGLHSLAAPYRPSDRMRPTVSHGNTRTPARQSQIDAAVDYLTIVDAGLLMDRRSRITVQSAYGVSKRQVFRWLREAGTPRERRAALDTRWKARLGRADERALARILRKVMSQSAANYRRARELSQSHR
jgi:hypothetical protein